MKLSLTIALTLLTASSFAQIVIRPNLGATLRVNIPLKPAYRQLRISPLPLVRGKIDRTEMILKASKANINEVELTQGQRKLVSIVVNAAKKNSMNEVRRTWTRLLNSFQNQTQNIDVSVLIDGIAKESHLESEKELAFYAYRLEVKNERKAKLIGYLASLRRKKYGCTLTPVCSRTVSIDIERYIDKLTYDLSKVDLDSNIMMQDLQGTMQRRNNTLTLATNLIKSLHDDAQRVIQSVGR